MKNKFKELSMKRMDFIIIGTLLLLSLIPILVFSLGDKEKNSSDKYLSIQVSGVEIKKVSLEKGHDEKIPITKNGKVTNLVAVKDGVVDMIESDCPDQLCVKATPISKVGETIVCLPNKVVLEIKSTDGENIKDDKKSDVNSY